MYKLILHSKYDSLIACIYKGILRGKKKEELYIMFIIDIQIARKKTIFVKQYEN